MAPWKIIASSLVRGRRSRRSKSTRFSVGHTGKEAVAIATTSTPALMAPPSPRPHPALTASTKEAVSTRGFAHGVTWETLQVRGGHEKWH